MMFQIITAWNFTRPDIELQEKINNVKLRGYNAETFLTGEFAAKIANREIKSLSVSDIADTLCPTRRDLYYKKGKNKPSGTRRSQKTWGNVAGYVVENFTLALFDKLRNGGNVRTYSNVTEKLNILSNNFRTDNSGNFTSLNRLKSTPEEDPDWLLKLLDYNGRAELGLKLLHKKLLGCNSEINLNDFKINQDNSLIINPTPKQIGISRGVKPDFLIGRSDIVGDIKSGMGGFQDRYLLTCVGYALAYENEKGNGHNMNFGVIYFLPTRHSRFVRPISFSQVYIFPIDDNSRQYFMDTRNEAYSIISKDLIPKFPHDKDHCSYCQFYEKCKKEGLTL